MSDDVNIPDSVHSRRLFSMPAQLMPVKAVGFPTSSRDTLAPMEKDDFLYIYGNVSQRVLPHCMCFSLYI